MGDWTKFSSSHIVGWNANDIFGVACLARRAPQDQNMNTKIDAPVDIPIGSFIHLLMLVFKVAYVLLMHR